MEARSGFLKPLKFLGLGGGDGAEVSNGGASIKDRRAKRHDLTGARINLLVDSNLYILHLKDLSALGLCGLTDAPLAPEQTVIAHLAEYDQVPIQIRWIRRTLIGASFFERLPDERLERVLRIHGKGKKRS
jgi:hypothetical protein